MTATRPHDGVIGYLEHARQCAESRSQHPATSQDEAQAEQAWAVELAAAIDWLRLAPRWSPDATTSEQPPTRPKLTLIRGDQH